MDFSTGFADRNGETVAMGLTHRLSRGSFPSAVRSILRKFDGRIFPGDVYIMNDPYTSGGIHLPDVYVIKPVFAEDEMQGFSCTVAHQTDIGGLVPGSNSTNSHEIYQEGLRIPTTKLYERGVPNETMFDLLATNVRVPDKVLGDIRAEIAAATLGERQFLDLVGRYGASGVRRYMDALLEYSERRVRQEITELPDGVYDFTHYIDGDNIETGDVVINLSMVIEGDGISVDFTGSSPQVKAGINSPFPFTKSSVWGGIRQIMDPEIPNSSGSHHPIKVTSPEATVVNPVLPAPCGARGIVGYRIMEAVWGALSKAVPDRVPADGEGGNTIISIGGYDSQRRPFAFVDLFAGSRGADPTATDRSARLTPEETVRTRPSRSRRSSRRCESNGTAPCPTLPVLASTAARPPSCGTFACSKTRPSFSFARTSDGTGPSDYTAASHGSSSWNIVNPNRGGRTHHHAHGSRKDEAGRHHPPHHGERWRLGRSS